MSVLNFSYARIKDADKFQEYIAAAAVLMQEAGVEVLVRGKFSHTMRGEEKNDHISAVFRYEDKEAVDRFYTSDACKKLIPLRDAACDMTIQIYEE